MGNDVMFAEILMPHFRASGIRRVGKRLIAVAKATSVYMEIRRVVQSFKIFEITKNKPESDRGAFDRKSARAKEKA